MNRFLTYTAVGLFLGLTPALAEDPAADQSQNPPAMQDQHQDMTPSDPAAPSEALPVEPSEPGTPIPDDSSDQSSQVTPDISQPDASPPAQSSQATPDPAAPPEQSSQAAPEPAMPPADSQAQSEAPKSIAPPSDTASNEPSSTPQFLDRQSASDWLASSLIGKTVVNASNESLGSISDLITGEDGKINAVLIRSGSFLGIGGKDIAVPFSDIKLSRDENDNVMVMANLSQDTIASAPDYETLSEQKVTVGSNKGDRENNGQ
jgi:sporulation protein YlmC with PRC-barrel domain